MKKKKDCVEKMFFKQSPSNNGNSIHNNNIEKTRLSLPHSIAFQKRLFAALTYHLSYLTDLSLSQAYLPTYKHNIVSPRKKKKEVKILSLFTFPLWAKRKKSFRKERWLISIMMLVLFMNFLLLHICVGSFRASISYFSLSQREFQQANHHKRKDNHISKLH